MGNLVSTTTPRATSVGISSYLNEIPLDITYDKGLGSSRFLKTIRCKYEEGYLVIKIFVKPDTNMSLQEYTKRLELERDLLSGIPNILNNHFVIETDRAGYLIRQYMFSSLYDRISTRPFLTTGEKKWIAFQLLTALVEAHSRHVYHGDIKTENVVVTSWNWAYLSDFSSFKPAYLPEDNPADYSFYFDTSTRRCCYLAPERFYAEGDTLFHSRESQITAAMDIFSLGCTIAEIFLDGTTLFTLSQLLRYRAGEYDPTHLIDRIDDSDVRTLIKEMIQLKPELRSSAQEYLTKWRGTVFPEYFYAFLHFYCASLAEPFSAPDSPRHHVFLAQTAKVTIAEADYKIDRIFSDFEQISNVLGISMTSDDNKRIEHCLPYRACVPGFLDPNILIHATPSSCDGSLILANAVCSSIRNCIYPVAKLRGIDLLVIFSYSMPEEIKLDRILPYICCLLSDENLAVRTNSLLAIAHLLTTVTSISPVDSNLFPEYIMPLMKKFTVDPAVQARSVYAQCMASLVESALRFLEMSQLFRGDEDADVDMERPIQPITYDAAFHDLQDLFQEEIIALLIDPSPIVRRALLRDISKLCIFFGRQKANDILLSHMITYLNDPDWQLRNAFAEAIVSVGTFVGMRSLEEYILPLMIQALTDAEEQVIGTVLNSLSSFAELGLIQKARLKDLCVMTIPLMAHPNQWIRFASIGFLAVSAKRLPLLDVHSILYPIIMPFLKLEIPELSEEKLLKYSKSPVNRNLYFHTVAFASKRKATLESKTWEPGSREADGTDLLDRLRDLGMTDEDKEKLFMLKYHISKSTAAKSKFAALEQTYDFHSIITFIETGITPHTVFLTIPQVKMAQVSIRPQSSSSKRLRGSLEIRLRPKSDSRRGSKMEEITNASQPHTPGTPDSLDGGSSLNRLSSSMNRRQTAYETIGNYDLTVDNSPQTGTTDKSSVNRWSNRVRQSSMTPSRTGIAADGQEKYIRRVLEKKIIELFPPLLPELGPKIGNPPRFAVPDVRPSSTPKATRSAVNVSSSLSDLSSWKPSGTLVAYFSDHVARVNAIRVAQDHSYFATCSDDGTVKVWDCHRLHTNVANRARLTYSGHGARVTTIACIENRHSIASASDNGQIHISRVEYVRRPGAATKYVGYSPVTAVTLQDDYAISLDHYETDSSSLLVYGTARGKVCALDLRTMKEAWAFHIPPYYGGLTSLVLDKKRSWLISGTSKGVLSLWDLRFQLCLKSWSHPSGSSISKLGKYPKAANINKPNTSKLVCMAVETSANEISIWDIETGSCTDVFCSLPKPSLNRPNSEPLDEINRIYNDGLKAISPPNLDSVMSSAKPVSMMSMRRHMGVTSFTTHPETPFLISGGFDRNLRFWDLKNPDASYIFSGPRDDLGAPRYISRTMNGSAVHLEYTPPHRFMSDTNRFGPLGTGWTPTRTGSSVGLVSSSLTDDGSKSGIHPLSPRLTSLNTIPASTTSTSRASVSQKWSQCIDPLQSQISKEHSDAITDVGFIQYPHPMVISCARDGVVKVWQ